MLAFLLLLALASLGFPAGACIGTTANFTCGDTVTEDCTLNESMTLVGYGTCLTVGAPNVRIDGNYHAINGPGGGTAVLSAAYDGLFLNELNVTGTGAGAIILGVTARIDKLTTSGMGGIGISTANSPYLELQFNNLTGCPTAGLYSTNSRVSSIYLNLEDNGKGIDMVGGNGSYLALTTIKNTAGSTGGMKIASTSGMSMAEVSMTCEGAATGYAFYLDGVSSSDFTHLNSDCTTGEGLRIDGCDDVLFYEAQVSNITATGDYTASWISSSNNIRFETYGSYGGNIFACRDDGVWGPYIESSSNISFTSATIANCSYGISNYISENISMNLSAITNASVASVMFYASSGNSITEMVNAYDTTYDNASVNDDGIIHRYWSARPFTQDMVGTGVDGAQVTGYRTNGSVIYSSTTSGGGYGDFAYFEQYYENDTHQVYLTPYIFYANLTGYVSDQNETVLGVVNEDVDLSMDFIPTQPTLLFISPTPPIYVNSTLNATSCTGATDNDGTPTYEYSYVVAATNETIRDWSSASTLVCADYTSCTAGATISVNCRAIDEYNATSESYISMSWYISGGSVAPGVAIQVIDPVSIISSFLAPFLIPLIALFVLGVSYIVSPAYSTAAFAFGMGMLFLFFWLTGPVFMALAVLGIVVGLFLKNMGM